MNRKINFINKKIQHVKKLTGSHLNKYMVNLLLTTGFKKMTAISSGQGLDAYGYDARNVKTGFRFVSGSNEKNPKESVYHLTESVISQSKLYHVKHVILIIVGDSVKKGLKELCRCINETNSVYTITLWNLNNVRKMMSKAYDADNNGGTSASVPHDTINGEIKKYSTEIHFATRVIKALIHCGYKIELSRDTQDGIDLIGTRSKGPRYTIGITFIFCERARQISNSAVYDCVYRIMKHASVHKLNQVFIITNGAFSKINGEKMHTDLNNIKLLQGQDVDHLNAVLDRYTRQAGLSIKTYADVNRVLDNQENVLHKDKRVLNNVVSNLTQVVNILKDRKTKRTSDR